MGGRLKRLSLLLLACALVSSDRLTVAEPLADASSLAVQPTFEHAATVRLPSVVSTNLCADLLLLRLGAPEQILSVSYQAQNPAQSPVVEQANQYPANRGAVEELLYFTPEIALTYLGWAGRPHTELLAAQGIRVVTLPYPRTIEDALSMTMEIAQEIDRSAAGERAVGKARARIKALSEMVSSDATSPDVLSSDASSSDVASALDQAPQVLYLRPNGGTAGSGTYVDAMLRLLGLRNLAADNGIRGWGTLPLEQLIADPPDLFLLGYFDQAQPQTKSRYGRHPLLTDLLERVPSIRMPSGSAWGCGGLELIDAAELIAEQLTAIKRAGELEPAPQMTNPAPEFTKPGQQFAEPRRRMAETAQRANEPKLELSEPAPAPEVAAVCAQTLRMLR